MAVNETYLHWSASGEVVTAYGQDMLVTIDELPEDPIGTIRIKAATHVPTGLVLPNSLDSSSPTWDTIPGTSPALEVRQDGYWPMDLIKVRFSNTFTSMGSLGPNIILGAVPAATRIEQSADVVRMRGFLQATNAVPSGTILARVAHPPLHAVSMGARYTGGTNRLQISTLGDLTFSATLNVGDQLWLDGLTYDLLA
jgi:hypothetical protein